MNGTLKLISGTPYLQPCYVMYCVHFVIKHHISYWNLYDFCLVKAHQVKFFIPCAVPNYLLNSCWYSCTQVFSGHIINFFQSVFILPTYFKCLPCLRIQLCNGAQNIIYGIVGILVEEFCFNFLLQILKCAKKIYINIPNAIFRN